jgi:glycerol-3-phosphate dehydrogenase
VTREEDIAQLVRMKEEAEALGVPALKIVRSDWLKVHEPNLSSAVVAALHSPTAGIICPYRLVYDLAENAASNGVEFHTSTKVTGVVPQHVSVPASPQRFEIDTTAGTFAAAYVVNAAGLFADEVSRMVGVDNFRITARKGEEYLLDKKREHLTNHIIFPMPTKTSKGILVIKTSDGNPMIGPTAKEVEDKEDLSTSEEGLAEVLASVKVLIPSISENDIIAYFAGLRPVAGEDFIIRHEDGVPGFVNVAGIQSPGLTASPAIALMVLDILKSKGLALRKKAFFHGHRRRDVHLFAIPLKETERLIKKDAGYGDIVCRCEMVSAKEVEHAIDQGATTMDGIKFRTRAQAGRCHGGFCTTRVMRILSTKTRRPLREITKRGKLSEIVKENRANSATA